MKYLWPRSLAGQLLALVAVALVIAQAVNLFFIYRISQNQNMVEASSAAVFRIARTVERIETSGMRPDNRRRVNRPRFRGNRPMTSEQSMVRLEYERLSQVEERAEQAFYTLGLPFISIEAAHVDAVPKNLSNSVINIRPNRQMSRDVAAPASLQRPQLPIDGFIILSVQTANGSWLSTAAAVRDRSPVLLRSLIFQTVILFMVVFIPLILLARFISKPLKKLTLAAQNFEQGNQVALDESGPPDTRQLISAFNDMNSRVNALLDEKDVMLGAIGHDLRTPLAALRVRVENVEDDNERSRMIAGIEEMDNILGDILSLARIGRSTEDPLATEMQALIETVVNEYIDLNEPVKFSRNGRRIAKVHAHLIRRAIRNLIENAVKYGKRAEVSVGEDGDNLLVHVDDAGPGIAADKIAVMFEPFVRAEDSRNRSTGGSGLGLTLARAIARDHGGDIKLVNRASGGLRATLRLPIFRHEMGHQAD